MKTTVLEPLFNKSLKVCNFIYLYLKETPAQVFFSEYCKISKNTYFEEHLRAATPEDLNNIT